MTVFANDNGILCAGAAALDRIGQFFEPTVLQASNPGQQQLFAGGTARNVAVALHRFGLQTTLLSAVKDDADGKWIQTALHNEGLSYINLDAPDEFNSAVFTAFNDMNGDLVVALADMGIFEAVEAETLANAVTKNGAARTIYFDTNFSTETTQAGIKAAKENGNLVIGGVISPAKARRFKSSLPSIDLLFLNRIEAAEICEMPAQSPLDDLATALQDRGNRGGVITDGRKDPIWYFEDERGSAPIIPGEMVNSNGAGDALASGTIYALSTGANFDDAVRFGAAHGSITIETHEACHPSLCEELVMKRRTEGE